MKTHAGLKKEKKGRKKTVETPFSVFLTAEWCGVATTKTLSEMFPKLNSCQVFQNRLKKILTWFLTW